MMKTVNPYLNFDGNTEEVFTFYQSIFGGELQLTRFREMDPDMCGKDELDKVAHVALALTDDIMLMGSDVLNSMGQQLVEGNDFYINLVPENIAECEQLFNALSDGGEPEMPLQETEWAERFGMCTDRYGTRWMINYPGSKG